jgi:hypothetical protein
VISNAEREIWEMDPRDWPHTPAYRIFRTLYEEDDNLWWRAGAGHGQNAYDQALEEIDRLEAVIARASHP